MQQPFVDFLVWLRVPGDTIFAVGALALALFVAMLWLRPRREAGEPVEKDKPEHASEMVSTQAERI